MASSPLHHPNILTSSSSSSFGLHTTTIERTNTSDSNNSNNNNLAILSPSYSKDEDYDSIADDSQEVDEFQHDHDDEQKHNNDGEEEKDNLVGSGMLNLEALAPGESTSPIRGSSTATTTATNKVIVAGIKYDLCGSMYKRREGFGKYKENKWVKRSFTLYNKILCYHDEPTPDQITDPSKPRARVNLAKTETIAEMHSKHKLGVPTDHLLTINMYDPVIRSKRKWVMCCISKEEQAMWYNAIRAHDGLPQQQTQLSMAMGSMGSMGRALSSPFQDYTNTGGGHHLFSMNNNNNKKQSSTPASLSSSAPSSSTASYRPHVPSTPLIPRNVHLSSYLNHPVLKPSTRKASADDTLYDTVFQTTNGFALMLRVYVPTDNTNAPQMTLYGVIASHSWLDIRMRVIGYAPISSDQSWRSSKLKLGDAVYAVIHHFQLQPPSISQIVDENLRRRQQTLPGTSNNNNHNATKTSNRPNASSSSNNRSHGGNGVIVQATAIDKKEAACKVDEDELSSLIPRVPSSFPEIEGMSLSELKDLVNNKEALDTFLNKISVVANLKELKESIETANVDTATANLALEEKVESICTEVETLKQDLKSNVGKYQELDARRAAMTRPPEIHEAMRELTAAKKKALNESDEFADDWVESGGSDVSAFVKKFMETRVLHHTRAAKAERLNNLQARSVGCVIK